MTKGAWDQGQTAAAPRIADMAKKLSSPISDADSNIRLMRMGVDMAPTVFRECPNTWIDSWELMRIGGGMAWRTRVSDCRKLGMTIENRVRKKANGVKVSEYRFVPTDDRASQRT